MKLHILEVSWSIKRADRNAIPMRFKALIRFALSFMIQPRRPVAGLDSDGFLRSAIFHDEVNPYTYIHRPIIGTDPQTPLGNVLGMFKVEPQYPGDDVVDHDIILVWGEDRRVITGADLLDRLLRGIVKPAHG